MFFFENEYTPGRVGVRDGVKVNKVLTFEAISLKMHKTPLTKYIPPNEE